MRVLIVDDQPRVRQALRTLLEQEEIIVAGEAGGAEEAQDHLRQCCPDVVLLDWGLHGAPASSLLAHLRHSYPHVRVVVLSGQPGVEQDALAAGADAFVSKADPPERLLEALRPEQP